MAKTPIDFDVNRFFAYDPLSGDVKWKERPIGDFPSMNAWKSWNARYAATKVGHQQFREEGTRRYLRVRLNGRAYMVHRIAYQITHGSIPHGMDVRHVNRDPFDNRAANLRLIKTGTMRRIIGYNTVDANGQSQPLPSP